MQINKVNNTSFGHMLVLDPKIVKRANEVEKEQLKLLRKNFNNNGQHGKIKVDLKKAYSVGITETNSRMNFKRFESVNSISNTRITIKDVIKILKTKFNRMGKYKGADKTTYEAFGDGYIL